MEKTILEKDNLTVNISIRYGLDTAYPNCITDYVISVGQLEYEEDSEPKESCIARANILYIEGYNNLGLVLDASGDIEPFTSLLNDEWLIKDYWDEYYREDVFFIINLFKLEKDFRNKKLGLEVMRLILKSIGAIQEGYSPIFLIPAPLDEESEALSKKDKEKAKKKLISIYKNYGFKKVEQAGDFTIMGILPSLRSKLTEED